MPESDQHNVPGFDSERCAAYLAGTEGSPPRELLVRTLDSLRRAQSRGTRLRALDLGCGPGRECVALLQRGFRVVAVDPYAEMLERARALVQSECADVAGEIVFLQATLERFAVSITPDSFDLVHAGFVLPFVASAEFTSAFALLRAGIAPGGYFVGQFFGPEDEFIRTSPTSAMTAHTASDIPGLFDGFELLEHEEVNREGRVGRGRSKWWHVHHVVARRASGH
jgi:tellurite methyltransferase